MKIFSRRINFLKLSVFNFQNYRGSLNLIMLNKFPFARKNRTESEEELLKTKNMEFAGEKKINKKTQAINDFGISNSNLEEASSMKSQVPESEERITTKLLCDIIGSKHYLSNEEISMDKNTIVSVYDENEKFMTNMSLDEARELARSSNKDIVLRNSKSSPVIIKIMKYKAELIKRLLKKIGKNIGRELTGAKDIIKSKIMAFSHKADKKDFESKIDKLRQMLLENNNVKLVIPCDLKKLDETTKAISILKNLADEVSEMGKIKSGPIKQLKKKEKLNFQDPGLDSSVEEITYHDRVLKEAKEASSNLYLENEKDLEYVEFIYLELESLVIDTGGIDYEKLLESSNIENLVRGITQTNVASNSNEKIFEESISKGLNNLNVIDNESIPLKNQIDYLEKQAAHQKDLRQKLITLKSIDDMKSSLELTRARITVKIIKNKMSEFAKLDAKKSGLLDKKA